jgi:hypothetical protein
MEKGTKNCTDLDLNSMQVNNCPLTNDSEETKGGASAVVVLRKNARRSIMEHTLLVPMVCARKGRQDPADSEGACSFGTRARPADVAGQSHKRRDRRPDRRERMADGRYSVGLTAYSHSIWK